MAATTFALNGTAGIHLLRAQLPSWDRLLSYTVPLLLAALALLAAITGYHLLRILLFPDWGNPARNLPGPSRGHWFLGNLGDVLGSTPGVLHKRWVDAHGPTLRFYKVAGRSGVLTTDLTALSWMYRHPDDLVKDPGPRVIVKEALGRGLVTVEGAEHRRQRRVLNPAFGWAQVADNLDVIFDTAYELQRKVHGMLEEKAGDGRVLDVLGLMSEATLDMIGRVGFGYEFGAVSGDHSPMHKNYVDGIAAAFDMSLFTFLQIAFPTLFALPSRRGRALARMLAASRQMGKDIVAEKKRTLLDVKSKDAIQEKDILSLLIRANMAPDLRDDQRLDDIEVVEQIATLLFAGHETTSTALMWTLYHLSLRQDVQDHLRAEVQAVDSDRPSLNELNALPYLDAVVHETLRLEPAIPITAREATRDLVIPLGKPVTGRDGSEITEIRLQKGQELIVPMALVNRSTEIWGADADEFNPDRARGTTPTTGVWGNLLTFGSGPRNCIGHRLAVAKMKAILFVLLRSFAFEQPDPPPEIVQTWLIIQRAKVKGEEERGPQMPLLVRPLAG